MKVLLINGSSKEGCTYTALSKVAESLKEENPIETMEENTVVGRKYRNRNYKFRG